MPERVRAGLLEERSPSILSVPSATAAAPEERPQALAHVRTWRGHHERAHVANSRQHLGGRARCIVQGPIRPGPRRAPAAARASIFDFAPRRSRRRRPPATRRCIPTWCSVARSFSASKASSASDMSACAPTRSDDWSPRARPSAGSDGSPGSAASRRVNGPAVVCTPDPAHADPSSAASIRSSEPSIARGDEWRSTMHVAPAWPPSCRRRARRSARLVVERAVERPPDRSRCSAKLRGARGREHPYRERHVEMRARS